MLHIRSQASGTGSFALHFKVEKCIWPEPPFLLGHHDSSLLPFPFQPPLPHSLTDQTPLYPYTHVLTRIYASGLLQTSWLRSYWEITAEFIKLRVCKSWWDRREAGAAGGLLICGSVQEVFTISFMSSSYWWKQMPIADHISALLRHCLFTCILRATSAKRWYTKEDDPLQSKRSI